MKKLEVYAEARSADQFLLQNVLSVGFFSRVNFKVLVTLRSSARFFLESRFKNSPLDDPDGNDAGLVLVSMNTRPRRVRKIHFNILSESIFTQNFCEKLACFHM